MNSSTTPEEKANRDTEALAMTIVFQLGDLLYDALPKDIAHNSFVDARRATNERAIDHAKGLIKAFGINERIKELKHAKLQSYITGPHMHKVDRRIASLTNQKEELTR